MACNICDLIMIKVTPQQTIVKTILIIVMFYSVLVPIFKFLCSCPLKKNLHLCWKSTPYVNKKENNKLISNVFFTIPMSKSKNSLRAGFQYTCFAHWLISHDCSCNNAWELVCRLEDNRLGKQKRVTCIILWASWASSDLQIQLHSVIKNFSLRQKNRKLCITEFSLLFFQKQPSLY